MVIYSKRNDVDYFFVHRKKGLIVLEISIGFDDFQAKYKTLKFSNSPISSVSVS